MSAKAIAVHREGATLFITTEDEDGQRVHQFPADPPPPPTPEELANWRGEGQPAEIGPEGPATEYTPDGWVRNCAREACLAHDHLAAQAREPEREDLTHLLG